MRKSSTARLLPQARVLVALAAFAALPALAAGCSDKKLEAKECDKLRGDAFDLLNKAQHCSEDKDCRQSEWPGCAKPLTLKSHETLAPMKAAYTEGKCEEPKTECKEPPVVYCKQGLCVHREVGATEGSDNTPTDQIKIQ